MTITNKVTLKSLNAGLTPATDVPDAPTIGTATLSQTTASVTFTPAATGGTPTSYTVTSSPGGLTGTGSSSPISVANLVIGTTYTFTVTATNSAGTSPASSASNSVTPTMTPLGYESIQTVTVGAGGSSSITFSSIPQTFTNLQVRAIARGTNASVACDGLVTFNSTSTGYYMHQVYGEGSSVIASSDSTSTSTDQFYFTGANATANVFGVGIMDVLDYTSTNKYKTTRTIGGNDTNGGGLVILRSGLWQNTAAISTITITPASGNFAQYSQFELYGVK